MLWDLLLFASLLWVILRLYQLTNLSRETLEERLGYEIPPTPEISVAGVSSSSVLLYWINAAHTGFLGARLSVLCNGINVGTIDSAERSIEVSPLKPDRCYNIKLVSINAANVSTISAATRVQTSSEYQDPEDHDEDTDLEPVSVKKASSTFHNRPSSTFHDDSVQGLSNSAKGTTTRRTHHGGQSAANSSYETAQGNDAEKDLTPECLQSLAMRLELLKKQKEETDRQVEMEEAEARIQQRDLFRARDDLRHELRLKEESSAELRRQGNNLDKLNRLAQSRRTGKEKTLMQIKAERQKVKDEIARWENESVVMAAESESLEQEHTAMIDATETASYALRQDLLDQQSMIKGVEDDIRAKGAQIKSLEHRRGLHNGTENTAHETDATDKARDAIWEANLHAMQVRLQSVWNALQQSKTEETQAENHLAWWLAKRARSPNDFPSISAAEYGAQLVQRSYSQNPTTTHVRSNTHPSQSFYTKPSYQPSPLPSLAQWSAPHSKSNAGQHQDLEGPPEGAMVSPAANDLLPSYLFRDEDHLLRSLPTGDPETSIPGSRIRHTISSSDASARGINTPISTSSRSGSIFTSPHDSMQNVTGIMAERAEIPMIPSGTSSSSKTDAEATTPASSRFANLFSPFARQRGKPNTADSPALGTLKQGQSQSFPRQVEQEILEGSGLRRRRGSHSAWVNPMAGLLGKGDVESQTHAVRTRAGSNRSNRLNVLRPRISSMETGDASYPKQIDSRASSSFSVDQVLNRPSSESANIWSSIGETMPNRESPVSSAWNVSAGRWSSDPSRSASMQHGSSTSLSLGTLPLDADNISRPMSRHRAEQAPIGTRPSATRQVTPKLNPTAPSFKTLFSRGDGKKGVKATRQPDGMKCKLNERSDGEQNDLPDDVSPPTSRRSKDALSINTATSTAESHESSEKMFSQMASESPGPKETLMQRITRKSSSSKFNVPWGKERGLFSKRSAEPPTPGDTEVEAPNISLTGKTPDSLPQTPREDKPTRGWSSMRRKSKRGNEASEIDIGTEEED